MRIAFTNWTSRLVGGAEQYLESIAGYLSETGDAVALWHEGDAPGDRPRIKLPQHTARFNAAEMGFGESLAALRAWQPDVIFCQGMGDPASEFATQQIAPSVFFAHNFHGLCISGGRTHYAPAIAACQRSFGPACLLHYLPRRCGGLNPLVMIGEYQKNRRRLEALAQYSAVITHSEWVNAEFRRHSIGCRRVGFFALTDHTVSTPRVTQSDASEWRLLMMGRMASNKGGAMLLEALPAAAAALDRPLRLIMAGDGPMRRDWEQQAHAVQVDGRIAIEFPGWVSGADRSDALACADLVIVPSLWPEPFGMTGVEAGHYSVPTVAFAMGGIPDWLQEGVNGCLAPADPPTPEKLGAAIVRCLSDRTRYQQMRVKAREAAASLTIEKHALALRQVLAESANRHVVHSPHLDPVLNTSLSPR